MSMQPFMEEYPDAQSKPAPAPFDSADSDIVLHSDDGVDFRTYRFLLSMASSVFTGMFASSKCATDQAVSIVPLYEPASLVTVFLTFCHPNLSLPTAKSVQEAAEWYRILDKFLVEPGKQWARQEIMKFVGEEPVAVYVQACRFNWKEEAEHAAHQTLKFPLGKLTTSYNAGLSIVPAQTMQPLWMYHTMCTETMINVLTDTYWADFWSEELFNGPEDDGDMTPPPDSLFSAEPSFCCSTKTFNLYGLPAMRLYVKKWWFAYIDDVRAALMEIPDIDKALEPERFFKAIKIAGECKTCCPQALPKLTSFARYDLIPGLTRAVKQIKPQFEAN
ncbi:unnamed protein product [Somion occarium]|uniref:BTB domain-containing protein n=1 Tax=Somion occarium TaxID=3059160 RepID=A0ABP1D4P6_9APHY